MNPYRLTLIITLFIVGSFAFGQTVKENQNASGARHPNFGIGFRVGDPSGLSLKKYFNRSALEFSIGRTHLWNRGRWYNREFDHWYRDHYRPGYKEFQYLGYRATVPIGLQLHYLIHRNFNKATDEVLNGLTWYCGFGAQLRFQTYSFDYRYKLEGSPAWRYETGETVTDLDIGPDVVIGLEYIFPKAPISIFGDATLFMEVADDPFLFRLQGGFGLRYNF